MRAFFYPCEVSDSLFPRIFLDVHQRFADLAGFFPYDPWNPDHYRDRAEWLDRSFPGSREVLANALVAYNASLGASETTIANARALHDSDAFVVITGQQPGLLGGPLYTLYKAVTAVRTARWLEELLGRRVVPMFWIASEDHDFEEVRRAFFLDSHDRLRELKIPPTGSGRVPLGKLPVPRRLEGMFQEIREGLGERFRYPSVSEHALQVGKESTTWDEWFAKLMAAWFSDLGLVLFHPMLPEVRGMLRTLLPQTLVRSDRIHREIRAAAARLQRKGYKPGLHIEADHSHLFLYSQGERLALFWRDGHLEDREGTRRYSVEEISRTMRTQPERFSPNVVLRPLFQEVLIPTIAFVAGPGEMSYLAQLRDVYELFHLRMPVVLPRLSLTLIGPGTADKLHALGMGAGQFFTPEADRALQQTLDRLDPIGIDASFDRLEQRVREAYGEVLESVKEIRSDLQRLGEQNFERVLRQMRYFRKKSHQHHRRVHRELLRRFQEVRNALRPREGLQERTLSVLPILSEWGPDLIRALLRSPSQEVHQVAILETETHAEAESTAQ